MKDLVTQAWILIRPWLRPSLYAGLGLVVAVDLFLPRTHAGFWWDTLPGVHVAFGVIASVLLVVVAQMLSRKGPGGLMRPEDYYDD